MAESEQPKKGYGKRPLWQWVLIYVIVGGILYFGVYYFFINKNTAGSGSPTSTHSIY